MEVIEEQRALDASAKRKLPAEAGKQPLCGVACGGPFHDKRATIKDDSFVLWATSEEVRKRSLEIYDEMRAAKMVWEIRNGKMTRVANPVLEMTNVGNGDAL